MFLRKVISSSTISLQSAKIGFKEMVACMSSYLSFEIDKMGVAMHQKCERDPVSGRTKEFIEKRSSLVLSLYSGNAPQDEMIS